MKRQLMLLMLYSTNSLLKTITDQAYFKNHWTKHRLVCIHFDAFSMLIPNVSTKCNNSGIFENFLKNARCHLYCTFASNMRVNLIVVFEYWFFL